jgi:predicted HTH transcriptional regulator
MTPTLISIIILLAAAVVGLAVWARKEAKKHNTSAGEEFVGICASAIETASQKEGRKQTTLAMIQEKDAVSNFEIRKALGVSSRTAVRYLDELEREGKVEQVGKIGHAVTYRLK